MSGLSATQHDLAMNLITQMSHLWWVGSYGLTVPGYEVAIHELGDLINLVGITRRARGIF